MCEAPPWLLWANGPNNGTFFWTAETDISIFHDRLPKTFLHFVGICFVCVGDAVQHGSQRDRWGAVIDSGTAAKDAGFNISLTFPRSQKNISPASALQHSFGNSGMLGFVPIAGEVRTMQVPLEMRTNLILHIGQIGINGKIRAAVPCGGITQRTNPFGLTLNGVHDADLVNDPEKGWFPITAFQNPFQSLIGWYRIAAFFSAYAGDGIAE